jgi:Tfp pilus assembly protein PilN
MIRSDQHFNLLPWRKKMLTIKILQHVLWHILIFFSCMGIMNGIHFYLGRTLLSKQTQLARLNERLTEIKIREVKRLVGEKLFRQRKTFQQTITENKQNRKRVQLIFNAISDSLASRMFITAVSIDYSSLTFIGKAYDENDLLPFTKRVEKNAMFKSIHFKKMEKTRDQRPVEFEIQALLKQPLA